MASPRSTETNLSDTILKVACAAQNLYFNSHEINWQIASIDFWKAHRILLSRNDCFRLPLLAAINSVENLLLGKAMMIGKALGIDQLTSQLNQALLEAFRLRNSAERRDLSTFHPVQGYPLACEHIFQIKGVMNAFNQSGGLIELRNPAPQFFSFPVAFGYKNIAGPRQMGRRFAQSAPGQKTFVAKGLLPVDQHDVQASAFQFPI